MNYGYYDIAYEVAKNLLQTLCNDLDKNGSLHEYYNPETGISNINKGFLNWNALAGLMYPELLNKSKKRGIYYQKLHVQELSQHTDVDIQKIYINAY